MMKPRTCAFKGLISLSVFLMLAPSFEAGQEKSPAMPEMTTYFLALLSRGPKATAEQTPDAKPIWTGHMKNIQTMAADGKLVAAGPMADTGPLRGIFILAVRSLEEAKALADADPAVKAGLLVAEVHPWMSQKGIGARNAAAVKADPQHTFEMTTYQLGLGRPGPKAAAESTPETQKLRAEHLANILKLIASGKLGLAGPCLDNGGLSGVFVFQVGSIEEAKALADSDPLVKAGILVVELHPWMAAKGTIP